MKEFIEYIIKNLVNDHTCVVIRCNEDEHNILIEIKVDPKDIGKVVGRKGLTIKALRTISILIGIKIGKKVKLDLVE